MDLRDLEHNTRDGLHIASMAGSWIAAVAGFGGMRDHGDTLAFAPRLPPQLGRLQLRMVYRGRHLVIDARHDGVRYAIAQGDELELVHDGERFTLTPGEPVTRPVAPTPELPRPQQPPGRTPARRSSRTRT
jgi:alpha,alpha-trehalose phosphorylase